MAFLKDLSARLYAGLFGNERYARRIGVTIGTGCRILTRRFGIEPWLVAIGDRVTLSRDVWFYTHDGATWLFHGKGRRHCYGAIRIGSDVFVGAHTILLPGVEIGDRVVIGAGSVVTRSVPSGVVVAGNPARIIGLFDDLAARHLAQSPTAADIVPDSAGRLPDRVLMPPRPVMAMPPALAQRAGS